MQRARAAWRLLHAPDANDAPVVIMLPRLVRQAIATSAACQPGMAAAAAHTAAVVRLEQAEAAAQAAALRAAAVAASAGLPYVPPQGVDVDVSGIAVVGGFGFILLRRAPAGAPARQPATIYAGPLACPLMHEVL